MAVLSSVFTKYDSPCISSLRACCWCWLRGEEALQGPKQGHSKLNGNLVLSSQFFKHTICQQPTKIVNTDSSGQQQDLLSNTDIDLCLLFWLHIGVPTPALISAKIKQAEYPMSGLSESSPIPINKQLSIFPRNMNWQTHPCFIDVYLAQCGPQQLN